MSFDIIKCLSDTPGMGYANSSKSHFYIFYDTYDIIPLMSDKFPYLKYDC